MPKAKKPKLSATTGMGKARSKEPMDSPSVSFGGPYNGRSGLVVIKSRTLGRGERVVIDGREDYEITAKDGGNLVHRGSGEVSVVGLIQRVAVEGPGKVTVNGNVERNVELKGAGKIAVIGDVYGNVHAETVKTSWGVTVSGDVYGDVLSKQLDREESVAVKVFGKCHGRRGLGSL